MDRLDKILYESFKEKASADQKIDRQIISKWEKEAQTMGEIQRKTVWMKKPAVAVCLALLVMATGGIAYATTHFSMWKQQKNVKEYVKECVYQDSDEHVKITMEELLSDAVCVQGLVKVEAKDEEGKKWMKEVAASKYAKDKNGYGKKVYFRDPSCDIMDMNLRLKLSGKSGEFDSEFIKGASTDDTQYYHVFFNSMDSALMENQAKAYFYYQLPSGTRKTEIDVSCNVSVREYSLKSDSKEEISKFYTPQKIRITPLSYVIYGKNHGLYKEIGKNGQKTMISDNESKKEAIKSIFLIDKSQKKTEIDFKFSLGGMLKEEQKDTGYDCLVASGTFEKDLSSGKVEIPQMNINGITGVQLTNYNRTITYKLKEIKK